MRTQIQAKLPPPGEQHQDNDPIFALACSPSRAALHFFRVSGPGCWAKLVAVLRVLHGPEQGQWLGADHIRPRRAQHLSLCAVDGSVIDDVVVTFFAPGSSYTGEESAEFTSHGNPLIAARIHTRLRQAGLRDAMPGEFTQRAYHGGKLDLIQVEAIAALVQAETLGGLELARQAANGAIASDLAPLRQALLDARTELEARIDFAEDEVGSLPWPRLVEACERAHMQLARLEASYSRGRLIMDGLGIALLGAPNAGKSTLYNALLREDRALVSDQKGTTRDVLRERLRIDGRDFILLDTAGLHASEDKLEVMGMSRTRDAARTASIVVVVMDLSSPDVQTKIRNHDIPSLMRPFLPVALPQSDEAASTAVGPQPTLLTAFTKSDCVEPNVLEELSAALDLRNTSRCIVCCQHDVSSLEALLIATYDELTQNPEHGESAPGHHTSTTSHSLSGTLISARQRDAVASAREHLHRAQQGCINKDYPETIASDIMSCETALSELMGKLTPDEIFHNIFSTFCVGK